MKYAKGLIQNDATQSTAKHKPYLSKSSHKVICASSNTDLARSFPIGREGSQATSVFSNTTFILLATKHHLKQVRASRSTKSRSSYNAFRIERNVNFSKATRLLRYTLVSKVITLNSSSLLLAHPHNCQCSYHFEEAQVEK